MIFSQCICRCPAPTGWPRALARPCVKHLLQVIKGLGAGGVQVQSYLEASEALWCP
jgi:hypothetical protein